MIYDIDDAHISQDVAELIATESFACALRF